jgi:hypothetical protein
MELNQSGRVEAGPEQFKLQGILHKRAVAATGHIYY